jgi:hypothetical protein
MHTLPSGLSLTQMQNDFGLAQAPTSILGFSHGRSNYHLSKIPEVIQIRQFRLLLFCNSAIPGIRRLEWFYASEQCYPP